MNDDARDLGARWSEAERSLPPGWRVMGIVRGPRGAHPQVPGHHWVAWARPDPDAGMADDIPDVEASGPDPAEALAELAERLRAMASD